MNDPKIPRNIILERVSRINPPKVVPNIDRIRPHKIKTMSNRIACIVLKRIRSHRRLPPRPYKFQSALQPVHARSPVCYPPQQSPAAVSQPGLPRGTTRRLQLWRVDASCRALTKGALGPINLEWHGEDAAIETQKRCVGFALARLNPQRLLMHWNNSQEGISQSRVALKTVFEKFKIGITCSEMLKMVTEMLKDCITSSEFFWF